MVDEKLTPKEEALERIQSKIFDAASLAFDRLETASQVAAGLCGGRIPTPFRNLTLKECLILSDFYAMCIDAETPQEIMRCIRHPWSVENEIHPKLEKALGEYYKAYKAK